MASLNPTNLRKIAEEAGVSHITVSRALRGMPNVSPATRERVLEVARRLGYKNNPLVQAYMAHIRRRGRAHPVAVNLVWLRSAPRNQPMKLWQRRFFEGAQIRAVELGFNLDATVNAHGQTDAQLDRILGARGVQGVVLPFSDYIDREPYLKSAFATVAVGESPAETPVHTVTADYFKNLTVAMDRLIAYGYRRIAFCEHSFPAVLSQGAQWGAYLLNQRRRDVEEVLTPLVGLPIGSVPDSQNEKRFVEWLHAERPDAVLATFSMAREWAERAGYSVPEDLAIVHLGLGLDVKGWSGMDFNEEEIGAGAIDLLTAHILRNEYGIPEHPKRMRIPGRWVDGSTTIRPKGRLRAVLPASHNHAEDWFESEFWNNKKDA